MSIVPQKLASGDEIRVVAPARSLSIIGEKNTALAKKKLESTGYTVTFSEHCLECDLFASSSIQSRIADLHAAFADKKVKAILTAIGGFNSNQLLPHLDYDLIKKNPKILCGYSDITALANGIFAKTGIVTYSGPHFSTFAMQKEFEFTQDYFNKCLVKKMSIAVVASKYWSDDQWYLDQEKRELHKNDGLWIIQEGSGSATGTIVGGNITIFSLLFGTPYMPNLKDAIVFLEDDELAKGDTAVLFDDKLHSLFQQPGADGIKGIVIGRFQKKSNIQREHIAFMFKNMTNLNSIPVVANVDFGHTYPLITFPIGGKAELLVKDGNAALRILDH